MHLRCNAAGSATLPLSVTRVEAIRIRATCMVMVEPPMRRSRRPKV